MIGLPLLLAAALVDAQLLAPTPPQTGSASARATGQDVVWASSYEEAVEKARAKGEGRILVFLSEKGCGECDRQSAIIVPSTSFATFMADKVPVRIAISSLEGKKLAERFGIPAPPAWIVLTTDGLLCGIQGGSANQGSWFETFVKTEQAWADYKKKLAREQKDPSDLALVFKVAEETYKRGGDGAAEPRFRRIATTSTATRKMREQSLAYLASIEMDADRIADAEKDLHALLDISTDEMLRQRAELRLADVDLAKGRKDLAITRLRKFQAEHPASALVGQAEELLKRLEPGAAQ